jgi:hypothetical protein
MRDWSTSNRRLNMYALAASAAGTGLLTFAQPADGKIIYTATHQKIQTFVPLHPDLNHDGKPDFTWGKPGRITVFLQRPNLCVRPLRFSFDGSRSCRNIAITLIEEF